MWRSWRASREPANSSEFRARHASRRNCDDFRKHAAYRAREKYGLALLARQLFFAQMLVLLERNALEGCAGQRLFSVADRRQGVGVELPVVTVLGPQVRPVLRVH